MFSTRAESRQRGRERRREGEVQVLLDGYAKERASALSCHYIICIISCGAQAAEVAEAAGAAEAAL